MTFERGSIVLVPFQYTDAFVKKKRPALVISNPEFQTETGHVVCLMITSRTVRTSFDVIIEDTEDTGLLRKSIVRTNKVFTIDESEIIRQLGVCPEQILKDVMNTFLSIFSN